MLYGWGLFKFDSSRFMKICSQNHVDSTLSGVLPHYHKYMQFIPPNKWVYLETYDILLGQSVPLDTESS